METVMVAIPSDAIRLTGIVDIRSFLQNEDALCLEQFAIDWIEKCVDRATETLSAREIEVDDNTFRAAIHYEVKTIIEVLRPDAACYQFFMDLESLTRSK